jgi:hypothetical protein
MIGWGILGLVVWVIIATWPARVASRKGHSFIGWFIISLFFWWITLFVVYAMQDKTRTAKMRADEAAVDKQLEHDENDR